LSSSKFSSRDGSGSPFSGDTFECKNGFDRKVLLTTVREHIAGQMRKLGNFSLVMVVNNSNVWPFLLFIL
jgi:hypothetical protein